MKKNKGLIIGALIATAAVFCSACGGTGTSSKTAATSSKAAVSGAQTSAKASVSQAASGSQAASAKGQQPMGGGVDKSGDTVLQGILSDVESKFTQVTYKDTQTGLSVTYNLFVPENYDSSKTYPLVLFIPDSSVVGKDAKAALEQGYGGVIWATDAEQKKHPSFILVPEYPDVVLDDHNGYVTTDYVELTVRLLDSVTSQYSVDSNRIYATGQSMGCMTTMILASEHPDLFAAEMFVDGQWDANTLKGLAAEKFFYFAAEGDSKAYSGMQELIPVLNNAGAALSQTQWDATWSESQISDAAKAVISQGKPINCITWKKGTVLPAGTPADTSEHMYSFDYAYKAESVRDWLFDQSKNK